MKIGVELEFFICHKSDETFYMPDIISRYLKYNSGFISMQKDSNGICIKADVVFTTNYSSIFYKQ